MKCPKCNVDLIIELKDKDGNPLFCCPHCDRWYDKELKLIEGTLLTYVKKEERAGNVYLGNDSQYHLTAKGFAKTVITFKHNAGKKEICKKHDKNMYWQDGKWHCKECKAALHGKQTSE